MYLSPMNTEKSKTEQLWLKTEGLKTEGLKTEGMKEVVQINTVKCLKQKLPPTHR